MKPKKQIEYWQSKFRILQDWKIEYILGTGRYCSVTKNVKLRKAYIYPFRGRPPKDYFLHEIIHLCVAEIKNGPCDKVYYGMVDSSAYEKEEIFVQDLCQIMKIRPGGCSPTARRD